MTYEKDIPDFALVPARQPEERILIPITQGAVYTPVRVTGISEKPKTTILVEEDILVPDTRPDMKEILQVSGKVRLASREFAASGKNEDSISLSGDVELQTLYVPEKTAVHGPVVSVGNRITFREQWHTSLPQDTALMAEACIEKIECTVINERKYRVKISIGIIAREFADRRIELFEGLSSEPIQTLRETVKITNVVMRKKDMLAVNEELQWKEGQPFPQNILKQDISVIENYRQAASEKIVINGFVLISLFYGAEGDFHQYQTRTEFTQFVPLQQGGAWSGCDVCFDGSDLRVKVGADENGLDVLRLEGDLVTWIVLYGNLEKEIIVDGYHQEKTFLCDFEETLCRSLTASASAETTVRELVAQESSRSEADRILYTTGEILHSRSYAEPGKVITEGELSIQIICCSEDRTADGTADGEDSTAPVAELYNLQHQIPFRCVAAVPAASGGERVRERVYLKEIWAEKAGVRQLELNAAILVNTEIMEQVPLMVLKNPAFEQVTGGGQPRQMSVYLVKPEDTLWTIAKHFQSTVDSIRQINQIEDGRLEPGRKLLILR